MRNTEHDIREKTEALLTAYDSLCRNVRNISVSDFLLLRGYAEKMETCAPETVGEANGTPPAAGKEKAPSGAGKKQKKKELPVQEALPAKEDGQQEEAPFPDREDAGEEAFSVFSMLRSMPDPYN